MGNATLTSSQTILPAGVVLTREPARTLLRLPAALALHDESPLPALLDALLGEPELRALDVQVYEPAPGEAAASHDGDSEGCSMTTLRLRATIAFSADLPRG
jgi:hypothetical protein